jgi:hypothetical protein
MNESDWGNAGMFSCKEPSLGALLHAYELNALSREDEERFETHMLQCDFCFSEVELFMRESSLLLSDESVGELVRNAAGKTVMPESFAGRLWRHLWPQTPVLLKPALSYLVILLMLLPAYHGIRNADPDNEIKTVQSIDLFPDRSSREETLTIGDGGDGLINFLFRDAEPGKSYQVLIKSENGLIVYQEDSFNRFDRYGIGRLVLPISRMKTGMYCLVVTDLSMASPGGIQEYRFRIE